MEIFTDGACRGNPGPGGWGVLVRVQDSQVELKGGEKATTNNRMELMAAIVAAELLGHGEQATIYTDSRYVQQGMTSWIVSWKRRGWKTASGQPVKNKDLWLRLDEAISHKDISWKWVKGHADNPGNEHADRLAREGLNEALGK